MESEDGLESFENHAKLIFVGSLPCPTNIFIGAEDMMKTEVLRPLCMWNLKSFSFVLQSQVLEPFDANRKKIK